MFPAEVRLTGTAVGTRIGFALGGFAPTIAAALAGDSAAGWVPVAVFGPMICAVICAVAAGSAWSAREAAPVADRHRAGPGPGARPGRPRLTVGAR